MTDEQKRAMKKAAQKARDLAAEHGFDSPEATAARKEWAELMGLGWKGTA